jgi:hypothetical protein
MGLHGLEQGYLYFTEAVIYNAKKFFLILSSDVGIFMFLI